MAQKMLDVRGYVVPRAGGSGKSRALLRPEPAVINETPITIFRKTPSILRAPRRSMMYLQWTQLPPAESLEEEWPLMPYGKPGSWCYVFKYKTGELCFYQLVEGEMQRHLSVSATLTSNDWSVLKMVMQQHLQETSQENTPESVPSKRAKLENLPACTEVLPK